MRRSTLAALLAAVAATFSIQVSAQESAGAAADDNQLEAMDEVVVVGVRRILRQGIAEKRESVVIADFLGTDDLAQTVDLNIADALRRLPGVNTIFDEDEGRYITVRGLESNFTYVSFDGIQLASVDRNSRRVNTEMIPPTAVQRVEVTKSLLPNLEGNAIGGRVNMVTRSAFDSGDFSANVNFEVGSHTSDAVPNGPDGVSPMLSAGLSTVFGENDQFGFVLGGYYFDKIRDQERFENIDLFVAPDGHTAIDDPFAQDYTNEIQRRSLLGKLEFRPSDWVYGYISTTWFDYQYDEVRYRNVLSGAGDPTGTGFLEGSFAEARGQHRVNTFPLNLTVNTYNGVFEYDIDDRSRLTFNAGYSEGTNDEPSLQVRWILPTAAGAGYSYSRSAGERGIPRIVVNDPSYVSDLSNYTLNRIALSEFNAAEEVTTIKGDYAWNMDADEGIGFSIGARYRTLDKSFDNTYEDFRPNGVTITGDDFTSATFRIPIAGWLAPISDFNGANEFRAANLGLFNRNAPDGDNIGRDFSMGEDVTAAYAMARYVSGPFELVGGLRYEQTDTDASYFLNNDGTYEPVSRGGSYSDVLPSVSATFELDDNKRIRAAYYRAIGRPNFGDLAGAGSAGRYDFDVNGDINSVVVSLSNTELEPRRADNIDLGFDWFIEDGQFFSIVGFYKNIDDYIFDATRVVTSLGDPALEGIVFEGTGNLASGGQVEITQPVNSQSAEVVGLEIQYIDEKLDFLPGFLSDFGIVANATFVDGEVDLPGGNGKSPLIEQPDRQGNLSVIYTLERFEGRLTFAYRDQFVNSLNIGDTTRSRYEDSYTDVNLDLRYDFTDAMVGTFKVRNLLDEPRLDVYGPGGPELGATREVNAFGQSFWLGLAIRY